MTAFDPYRAWKTLQLHGPATAAGILGQWAAVDPATVTGRDLRRVTLMVDLLDEFGMVEPDGPPVEEVDQTTVWRACAIPEDRTARRFLLRELQTRWRYERQTVSKPGRSVSPGEETGSA